MPDDPKDPRNRAERITDTFNNPGAARAEGQERSGSNMVARDAPRLELNPPGVAREEATRKAFEEREKQERAKEIEKRERLESIAKEFREKQRDKDRDKEKDR